MNARERFLATMNFQPRDRVPLLDIGFWSECFDVWRETGLPAEVGPLSTDRYFGLDGFMRFYLSPDVPLANYEYFLAECRQRWTWT